LDYENGSRIIAAKYDDTLLGELIAENKRFILKSASAASGSYIERTNDIWSVALIAFMQSVREYDEEKGEFYSFSALVIKRRIIEYFRKQNKYQSEKLYPGDAFEMEYSEDEARTSLPECAREQLSVNEDRALKYEIEALSEVLRGFGFDFFDLAEAVPKADKTKKACAKAVNAMLSEPALLLVMKEKNYLPIKVLQEKSKVPRKLLERHRKYIITASIIICDDYPHLAEYLHFIGKEPQR